MVFLGFVFFDCTELIIADPLVFILDTGISEDEPADLSLAGEGEVGQLDLCHNLNQKND